jgi:hypothetical protein
MNAKLMIFRINATKTVSKAVIGILAYNGELTAPEKNNSTSCLSFGPSTALHPPTRISICAAVCAL